jgi:hydrogenase expression/formation protein HypC
MCLGMPGRVVGIDPAGDVARVDVGGVVRDVNVGFLLDEPPAVGEYVLIHSGFALERMSAEQAQEVLDAFGTDPGR